MGAKHEIKPRTCDKCRQTKNCTAAELKEHVTNCKGAKS